MKLRCEARQEARRLWSRYSQNEWVHPQPDLIEQSIRSVDEMVDSVQSDESGNDKVDGNDVIQQARQNQDQDACDKRNDRRKMCGSEGHNDLLGG